MQKYVHVIKGAWQMEDGTVLSQAALCTVVTTMYMGHTPKAYMSK